MTQNQNPGDVYISSLTIDGTDFKDKLLSLSVIEDIFSPMIMAEATVIQVQGDQTSFQFNENSKAQLSFNTPSGNKRNYDLIVNEIKNPQMQENQTTRKFTIQMVSKHSATAASTLNYQKSIKNKTITDIVKLVGSEALKLGIPFNVSTTRGIQGGDNQPIILSQLNPFKHLQNLASMAAGTKNADAFMVYSSIGSSGGEEMNFKALSELLQQSPVATITNKTSYEINSTLNQSMINNIIDIKYPKQNSVLDTLRSRQAIATSYDRSSHAGTKLQTPTGSIREGSTPGLNNSTVAYNNSGARLHSAVVMKDGSRPPDYRAETSPYTQNILSNMQKGGVMVKIPGNSNIKVGDIINLELRENTDNFYNNDTRYYGKNIVTSINSFIGPLLDNPRYVSVLSLTNLKTADGSIK